MYDGLVNIYLTLGTVMLVFYIILGALLVAGGAFLAVTHRMHWTAFVATAAAALLMPLPVYAIGTAVAKSDQQTFHEYWNGYETAAYTEVVECERDGRCSRTYDCDPYTVTEVETYYNSEGDLKTRTVQKTKWHSCPYSHQETSYYVDSTLKTFTIASNVMTGEPFRASTAIPGGRITEPPAEWSAAQARLEAGKPGGVTTVNNYSNYILGSERSLFERYSDQIDSLTEKNLLPTLSTGVAGAYSAQKVYFVGDLKGVERKELTQDMPYLNGALGTELRGDLHVVFVDANSIKLSAEDYSNALLAHWQNKEAYGRGALAKNAIVLVVAVEGYKLPAVTDPAPEGEVAPEAPTLSPGTPVVKWAKAHTGMPLGNERLLQQFSSELPGTPVDGDFLGAPTYDVQAERVTHDEGVVESMLWGPNKFLRVSMDADDADDEGSGFAYLADQWEPDTGTLVAIHVVASIFVLLLLGLGTWLTMNFRANKSPDFVGYLFSKH